MRLYGISEIARACGATRQQASQWHHRGHLPSPDVVLAIGPVWFGETIEPWIAQRTAKSEQITRAVIICDLVASRHIGPDMVTAAVSRAIKAAREVQQHYPQRPTQFEVTTGDEWEGLIGPWDHEGESFTTELVRAWIDVLHDQPFRMGLGLGHFRQPRKAKDPRRMAGEPFYAAREAVEQAKTKHVRGVVLRYQDGASVPSTINPELNSMFGDAV